MTAVAQELNIELEFKEVSEHLDDVKEYKIWSTPTVFLFDENEDCHNIGSRTFFTLKEELEEIIGSNM